MPVPSGLVTAAPRVSAGYPECFESISKKASPFPAKAGNRDSIRSKVFEGNREGFGYDLPTVYEGRGVLEAASIGYDLKPGEMAMRCNLICVEGDIL
ncbi:hypothetical protein, partial [Bilophila wadsworthia]|uniref:hypothetical protein n=1 Tax=Bilophila wadsworthia TaxID=35833 RepID=UPI003AB18E05